MTLLLGDILKTVRKAVGWTQEELADKLGIVRGTYSSDERIARPGRVHGSLEFYERYKEILGIDLYQSVNKQQIIIIDPSKLPWSKIIRLKEAGASIKMTPVFNTNLTSGIIPFYRDEIYTKPAFFLPAEMYPGKKFGILAQGNSMEPCIYEGDYIICGPRLTAEDIVNGQIYLVGTDDDENTIKILNVDKKKQLLSLIPTNPDWKKRDIKVEKVRYIHKVIGLHRNEDGINKHAKPI
jgi:SOS-response transcriptional repressor LexA